MIDVNATRIRTLNQILLHAARARRIEITGEILRVSGPGVISGPFAGMRLPDASSWGDGDLAPKLLGCYEEELHPAIERAIARQPARVINVGCAEGYYAIGLARRLPQAKVFAFDIDAKAQEVCRAAAAENGVAERVTVGGLCTPEILRNLAGEPGRSLIFMDCEGGELTLLDAPTVTKLAASDVLVECHDFINRQITPTLLRLMGTNHAVEPVAEGARNPGRFPLLKSLSSLDRWLVMCEFRPEQMSWLACWAR